MCIEVKLISREQSDSFLPQQIHVIVLREILCQVMGLQRISNSVFGPTDIVPVASINLFRTAEQPRVSCDALAVGRIQL
jgi:hypothetical protein